MERFYAVVVGVLRVGRSRDEGQQMTHCVGSTRRGRGAARARVVGLPLLASFREATKRGSQSKGVQGSFASSPMSWKPANRLPNAQKAENTSVLLPLDNRTFADERRERSGRDEPNSRGKTSPVRTLPLLGKKTTSFID